uniref:F-box domain-containing protein n=1 Tax=Bionectria ochroleuca TaxID=29856 RepID=A0A8H7TNU0_BIOOC
MACTDGDTIKRLAWRPDDLNQSMLSFIHMPTPPLINVASRTPAFGSLDRLPPEILDMVLNLLDLQTLSRMTQTCFSGLSAIQSMTAYRELLEHAPFTIAALGQTKLLGAHTLAQLWGL